MDERRYPMSEELWLCQHRRAERSYSMFKVRRGGCEEISLVQGKRNPSKTVDVARGHQRANTQKPYSQKTSQSNHTRTTAFSKTSLNIRMWSTGEGNGNHFSILALRTP